MGKQISLFPQVTSLKQIMPAAEEDRTHSSLGWNAFSSQNKLNLIMLVVLYYSDTCWTSTLGVDFAN